MPPADSTAQVRGPSGFAAQMAVGAIAGVVFAQLTRRTEA